MILLLPGNALGLQRCGIPLTPDRYGWLLSPARTMTVQGTYGLKWAIDNEVYTGKYHPSKWKRALIRIKAAHGTRHCLFVVAPDVVGDGIKTLQQFDVWEDHIHNLGFPVALAAQDGMQNLELPWTRFDTLFVGGSTAWKMSELAATLMYEAKDKAKQVHVGRVNSRLRVDQLKIKPDSIDGTHWSHRPDIYIRRWHRQMEERRRNPCFAFYHDVPTWSPPPT